MPNVFVYLSKRLENLFWIFFIYLNMLENLHMLQRVVKFGECVLGCDEFFFPCMCFMRVYYTICQKLENNKINFIPITTDTSENIIHHRRHRSKGGTYSWQIDPIPKIKYSLPPHFKPFSLHFWITRFVAVS